MVGGAELCKENMEEEASVCEKAVWKCISSSKSLETKSVSFVLELRDDETMRMKCT